MTVDDAIKIVTCCEFDHGTPGERALLAEAEGVLTTLRVGRVGELRELEYAEYLKSTHWQAVRKAAMVRADHACQLCKSRAKLNVHHNTYDRLGCERDADVFVLCEGCHARFHDTASPMPAQLRKMFGGRGREEGV